MVSIFGAELFKKKRKNVLMVEEEGKNGEYTW